jgi:hypothetical protein
MGRSRVSAQRRLPCRGGQALSFSGATNNAVVVANDSNFDFVGALSTAAWIKLPPSGFTNAFQMIVGKADTAWRLQRYNTFGQIELGLTGTLGSPFFSVSNIPATIAARCRDILRDKRAFLYQWCFGRCTYSYGGRSFRKQSSSQYRQEHKHIKQGMGR